MAQTLEQSALQEKCLRPPRETTCFVQRVETCGLQHQNASGIISATKGRNAPVQSVLTVAAKRAKRTCLLEKAAWVFAKASFSDFLNLCANIARKFPAFHDFGS